MTNNEEIRIAALNIAVTSFVIGQPVIDNVYYEQPSTEKIIRAAREYEGFIRSANSDITAAK